MMSTRIAALLCMAWLLMGCEGPEGPTGPVGQKGEKGEKGDKGDPGVVEEAILVKVPITRDSYDSDNHITIADARITPTTFRLVYLELGEYGSIPLEYLVILDVSLKPEADEWFTTIVRVYDGRLVVEDPERYIHELTDALNLESPTVLVVVLQPGE